MECDRVTEIRDPFATLSGDPLPSRNIVSIQPRLFGHGIVDVASSSIDQREPNVYG
jgi:hypothetical protein